MRSGLLFSEDEFRGRCAAVQAAMATGDVDLLLLDQPEINFYMIGHAMSEGLYQACLVPREGEPVMVLRSLDIGPFSERAWITDIVGLTDWDDPIDAIRTVVLDKGWKAKRIGVDEMSYSLTVRRFRALHAAFPDAEFVDISGVFDAMRARKSPAEIGYLRKASAIADEALARLVDEIRPGLSARQCAAIAAQNIIRLGGDAGVVGPVTKSIDERNMHAILNDEPLEEGNTLHVEMIPQFEGYGARLMRPVHIGMPDSGLVETADAIVAVQDRQFAAMRPGVYACEVDAVIRDGMLREGLKTSYTNISGYSLGYYQLFTCRSSDFTRIFRPVDKWILEAGMVFHMYTVAQGLAFSETILVTDDGAERLTRTERRLLASLF